MQGKKKSAPWSEYLVNLNLSEGTPTELLSATTSIVLKRMCSMLPISQDKIQAETQGPSV